MAEDVKSDGKLNGWMYGQINRKEGRTTPNQYPPSSVGDNEPFNYQTFHSLAWRY